MLNGKIVNGTENRSTAVIFIISIYSNPPAPAHSHVTESGMIGCDAGEMVLQHPHGARQCHMPTAAEQSHAWEAQDGGHQRSIRHTAQTFDAAVQATYS